MGELVKGYTSDGKECLLDPDNQDQFRLHGFTLERPGKGLTKAQGETLRKEAAAREAKEKKKPPEKLTEG